MKKMTQIERGSLPSAPSACLGHFSAQSGTTSPSVQPRTSTSVLSNWMNRKGDVVGAVGIVQSDCVQVAPEDGVGLPLIRAR